MDSTTLILAGVLAIGIVLIAVGIAGSGGSGISERLERYAAKPRIRRRRRPAAARAAWPT